MLLSAADVSLFGWFSFLVAKSFTVDHRVGSMKNFIRTSPLAERFTMDSSPLTRSRARRNLLWFMRRGRPEKLIHTSGYAWNVISLIIYMKNIYLIHTYVYIYKSSYLYMTDNTYIYSFTYSLIFITLLICLYITLISIYLYIYIISIYRYMI